MAEDQVLLANNIFTTSFYRQQSVHEDSFLLSPLSVHVDLSLALQGAEDDTKTALCRTLKYANAETSVGYENVIKYINSVEDLRIANHVFISKFYEPKTLFIASAASSFLSQMESFNDADEKIALKSMKKWVQEKTNKKIASSASNSSLNNAVYFDGEWMQPFDPQNTNSQTFHVSDEVTVNVQMMKMKREVNFKHVLGGKVLELPYSNDEVSLVVVLPNDAKQLPALETSLMQLQLGNITAGMIKTEVEISIPKFKSEHVVDLKDSLSKSGLEVIFSKDANFSSMSNSQVSLAVSNVLKHAFIEVNEKGTTAAALTSCGMILSHPIIYNMDIKATISNRFAKTLITSKMKNTEKLAKKATFSVILPENAFISEFVMEVDGKSYKSYVKGKEEAKNIFTEAVAAGRSAGHVAVSARDSNKFSVDVNVEPRSQTVFLLTYEELLQRRNDQYELVLNIHPGQFVQNLNVLVEINESRPLKYVKTPALRSGNEIEEEKETLNPLSEIQMKNSTDAVVKFSPNLEKQKQFARELGRKESGGLSGQFVVQYDVQRDPRGGEVLLQDGYFVHFFAPSELEPLMKHVVFVLDTSGSMGGRKIVQLKDAMDSILSEIPYNDLVSIVEFNSNIAVWDINSETMNVINYYEENYEEPFHKLRTVRFPAPTPANEQFIIKAKNVIRRMMANGGTDINSALATALYMIKLGQEKFSAENIRYQPIVIFLTDGEPTVGVTYPDNIIRIVTKLNMENNKAPIFSLSFGSGADKAFLRKLSLKNFGFSRHIYEAADASLQLQQFYKQISSPLLNNISFKYDSEVQDVTRCDFPIFFRGSELVVSGRYVETIIPSTINCCGRGGLVTLKPIVERPITSLERLWAYLTVKQLLDERDSADDTNKSVLTKKALQLALKYSFVTNVSSLVVVKPDESNAVDTTEASSGSDFQQQSLQTSSMGTPFSMNLPRRVFAGFQPQAASFQPATFGSSAAYTSASPTTGLFGAASNPTSFGTIQTSSYARPMSSTFAFAPPRTAPITGFGAASNAGGFSLDQTSSCTQPTGFTFGYTRPTAGLFGAASDDPVDLRMEQTGSLFQQRAPAEEKKVSPPEEFVANHPFIVMLLLKKGDKKIVLFAGRVCRPE